MRITIRKGPPAQDTKECPVVAELWMTVEEAKAHANETPLVDEAIAEAVTEHLRTRYRVSRNISTGRHPQG